MMSALAIPCPGCTCVRYWRVQRLQEVPRGGHAAAARHPRRGGRRARRAPPRGARPLRVRLSQVQGTHNTHVLCPLGSAGPLATDLAPTEVNAVGAYCKSILMWVPRDERIFFPRDQIWILVASSWCVFIVSALYHHQLVLIWRCKKGVFKFNICMLLMMPK